MYITLCTKALAVYLITNTSHKSAQDEKSENEVSTVILWNETLLTSKLHLLLRPTVMNNKQPDL
jgi:hypothetical protein